MPYTKFIRHSLSFILFETYGNICIRALSSDALRVERDVNLEPIIGSMSNVTEAIQINKVGEETRPYTSKERLRCRGDYDSGSVSWWMGGGCAYC